MTREASHDEVKRAYLDQALRFHPDRLADPSPTARAAAEFRMREVNEAWSVLRNPATRARYDDELREEARASGASPGARSSGGADPSRDAATIRSRNTVHESDEAAELDPAEEGEVAPPPRRRRWAPLIVGGAVLVLVLAWATLASRTDDRGVKIQTVEQFAVGTCVAVVVDESLGTPVAGDQARQLIVSVPCTGPNNGRIVARVDFPRPCPVGRSLVLLEEKQALCLVDS